MRPSRRRRRRPPPPRPGPPPASSGSRSAANSCAGDVAYNGGIRSKIYAINSSKTRTIVAKIKYDTNPSGVSFQLLDQQSRIAAETYPLFHEFALPPSAQMQVGCTTTYRTIVGGDQYLRVGISASLDSASYAEAGAAPPADDAFAAGRLMTQAAADQSQCQGKSPSYLYLLNTHPSRTIAFTVAKVDRKRKPMGEETFTLAPMSNTRLGCAMPDKVNPTVERIVSAKFED
ncbi:MAG: hypothetical protein QM757_46165 [Paludibaculum sp.]